MNKFIKLMFGQCCKYKNNRNTDAWNYVNTIKTLPGDFQYTQMDYEYLSFQLVTVIEYKTHYCVNIDNESNFNFSTWLL